MGVGGRRPGEGAPEPMAMNRPPCIERSRTKARCATLALPLSCPTGILSHKGRGGKSTDAREKFDEYPLSLEGRGCAGADGNEPRTLCRAKQGKSTQRYARAPLSCPPGILSHKGRGESKGVCRASPDRYKWRAPSFRPITTRNRMGKPSMRSRATIPANCPPHSSSDSSANRRPA